MFWSELNYEKLNQPVSRHDFPDSIASCLKMDPLILAAGGQDNTFKIIYARLNSDKLLLGNERLLAQKLIKDHPYALFVFSNQSQDSWHFVNIRQDTRDHKRRIFRRITVGKEERLRTASQRIAMLDLADINARLFGIPTLEIQKRHDEAFDVEKVTGKFYAEYKQTFDVFKAELAAESSDQKWAHDYALQFLNRCMFLYFIQRKGWLGGDRDFLRSFWKSYLHAGQQQDSFVSNWLNVLFFEAFNNHFHGGHKQFPANMADALHMAPYLNGGLFEQNETDLLNGPVVTDNRFAEIFKFLECYNFTIAEDSPLDQEVAVDPEMIGKVYESLVNRTEGTDERHDSGIFYTPRTEIDLMCRLSLADNLANKLGSQHKNLLNQLVFSLEPHEQEEADGAITKAGMWQTVHKHLTEVTILDPACGSGSFLVGMLNVLNDLLERAEKYLGKQSDSYQRKKSIIGRSLYGVDIMPWACHVAELRLWLALVIDTGFTREELKAREEPLLPHFSFNIRCGDSMVQEVGGINLGHHRKEVRLGTSLTRKINALKEDKIRFYNSEKGHKSKDNLQHDELNLFREILDGQAFTIEEDIKKLRRRVEGPEGRRITLDGIVEEKGHQITLEAAGSEKKIEDLDAEIARLKAARRELDKRQLSPFVWDIAFVEVFEKEQEAEQGFDIVTGNPPYVRQESIADPHCPAGEITTENKKAYKAKLARSVYQAFPHFFGYKWGADTAGHKLDAKSDLYIYFYFHGLSLLNANGSFCFITSNSWLDVGYGKDLQEFLLKHCSVKMVLDNSVKRSFASADVNTIIALFSAPDDKTDWALEETARFVMFTVPFENAIDPIIIDEIESASEKMRKQEYRVFPLKQALLLQDGCAIPEAEEEAIAARPDKAISGPHTRIAKYEGNKWGGKYLRAPDIYWAILEKGKGKLVRLGDIAEVRRGITTGANEFFYLDEAAIREWEIEEEFLKPVIKSPRECKRILINPADLKYKIFMCHKDRKELKGTAALEYIKWGEGQEFNERPSCRGRARWWDVGLHNMPNAIWQKSVNKRHIQSMIPFDSYVDQRLYEIASEVNSYSLTTILNSAVFLYFKELAGRTNLGEGALDTAVYEASSILILSPSFISGEHCQSILNVICCRDIFEIGKEILLEDRRLLDKIVFDAFNLTQGERDAVYEAVISLVEARLKKADSM